VILGSGKEEGLQENLRRMVDDGSDTCFWSDPWLGSVPVKDWFSRLFELFVNKWGRWQLCSFRGEA